mmetsp:Transcript_13896/g.23297  ORF Transcript_13896/g.23297 Transcript_13896/m.23297 type:complete len:166 (-) Transcript_13896:155-652(-)
MSSENSNEFADILGAAVGTGKMMHDEATYQSYISLFTAAYNQMGLFTDDRKSDVALWICAAVVFNCLSKDGLIETNGESTIAILESCVGLIDSSNGGPAISKQVLVARLYDVLGLLYSGFSYSWCTAEFKKRIISIFVVASKQRSFNKIQKNQLIRQLSTLRARL